MPKVKYAFCLVLFWTISIAHAQKPAFLRDYNHHWVDSIFNQMSTDEKIGQLLLPRGNYSGKPHDVKMLIDWVEKYKIGGVVFFASQPGVQAQITNQLQAASKVPLLIGQDFEWGLGMRLDSTDRFPYAVALGAMDESDNHLIESMGKEIGRQCQKLGVHINYAPVVDININPNNPVINFRSFGENKKSVADKGMAYMKGLQSEHILCTAKHFPGHGDTDADSHHTLPVINHTRERLHSIELYPFKQLINNGLSGIMTAHLDIPSLELQPGLASTFSSSIITDLLKKELSFGGLVFTDAMEMEGAVKNFPKGEAMVRALLAGNDILETFVDVPTAVNAIREAVENGRIPMKMLDTKVKKILMAKSWVGLDQYKPIAIDQLKSELNSIESDVLNQKMAEKYITCLSNKNDLLPLVNLNQKMAVLAVESESETDFYKMVSNFVNVDFYQLSSSSSEEEVTKVMKKLDEYEMVLAGIHLINIRASKNYGLTVENMKIIDLLVPKNNVILSVFGNPFILTKVSSLSKAPNLIMAYQQNIYSENAVAQAIFGANPMNGKLPISFSENFKSGTGIQIESLNRLSYGAPELVGMDRRFLTRQIDSLVFLGLKEKAFPGCVVEVAKDGKVIFNEAYGFYTFEDADKAVNQWNSSKDTYQAIDDAMDNPYDMTISKPNSNSSKTELHGLVKKEDIYDLASITKISTSTLAIMQLMSDGKFDLDATLETYYPAFKNTNKAALIMRDMLTHRSGLKAWIPFWRDAIDTISTLQKALVENPSLESEMSYKTIKPNWFLRIFGKNRKKCHCFKKASSETHHFGQRH